MHDLGDVFWGFVFGVLCLAAYIAVERHDKSRTRLAALSLPQIALALLALQGLYVAFYPAHIGHEAPYWFIGLTTGWLVGRYLRGHEEVQMPGPLFPIGSGRRLDWPKLCLDDCDNTPAARLGRR